MHVAFTRLEDQSGHRTTDRRPGTELKLIRLVGIKAEAEAKAKAKAKEKIILPTTDKTYVLHWNEILHIESTNNYSRIYLINGKSIFLAKTLKHLESLLPASQFIRIHRSHLVRTDLIRSLTKEHVELSEGILLPLARQKYAEVLKHVSVFKTE